MKPRLGHVLTHRTEPSQMATLPSPLTPADRKRIGSILDIHVTVFTRRGTAKRDRLKALVLRWRAECKAREQAEIVASNPNF